jgi:hypothetical protein
MTEKEIKKTKLMVVHGKITHQIGKKCKFCDRVKEEFEKVNLTKFLEKKGKGR